MKSFVLSFLKINLFLTTILLFINNSYAAGFVNVSKMSVSPSPVTVGQNFDISFSLKEYKGESKSFQYIELWIQDQNGNDLYNVKKWNNVSFSANQSRNFLATTFLDPTKGRLAGSYRAIVRGKLVGDNPFNFGVVPGSNAQNPYSFTAKPPVVGRVDPILAFIQYLDLQCAPSSSETVGIGSHNPFAVTFDLKEFYGSNKTFEYIEIWIQDGNGKDLFRAEPTWNNQTFSPNEIKRYTVETFLDPAKGRTPGAYRAVIRGKVAGDNPFDFGSVIKFTAEQRDGVVKNIYGYGFSFLGSPSQPALQQTRQGQSGTFYFHVDEDGCGSTTLQYIEVWIQDGNGNDLWIVDRWDNISFSYAEQKDLTTTAIFIDPTKYKLGIYQVILRGKKYGSTPFNFQFIGGPINKFEILPALSGRVDISAISVSPSPVTIGQNFNVSFSLKEYWGQSKTFEYVELRMQDQNSADLYDVKRWDNVPFSANETRNFSATTFLDPAKGRLPGSYRAIVVGKLAGDGSFYFGVTPSSNATHPYPFTAMAPATPTVTSIIPTVVTQNVPATFTVVGTNLPDGLSFNLSGCSPAPEQPGGTATQRLFVCTPTQTGTLTAEVKDAQGNVVSGGTTMIAINLNWREVNPPSAVTQKEIAKESQYIVLVTHGWNSSAEVWPNELVRIICNKLDGKIQDGEAAGKNGSITGIDQYCYAGPDNNPKKWFIASYNWKQEADTGITGCDIFHLAIGCASVALRNAEMLGKASPLLANSQWQYMHLIGHSAGSGFIQQFALSVNKEQPVIKIHMTLLDSFCPDTKSCSYGEGATWAEQYFDGRDLDETEVKLKNAYNFNITALDQYGIYPGVKDVYQHAFPYKYYIATAGGTPDTFKARIENDKPFGANLAGWMLEWVAWYQNKNSYPLEKLKEDQERYGRGYCKLQDEEGLGLSKCKDQWGEPVYAYTPRSFESQMTDDQCPAELTANGTWFQATVTAKTCLSGQQAQAIKTVKALDASALPNPGMALLRVTLSGLANRLSFDYRFTEEGADGTLQVFIDNDELAYVTTQALDGTEWRHAGRIDIPTLQTGEHALRIVVKALSSHNVGVEVTHILYEEAQSQAVPVPAAPVITSGPSDTVNTTSATFTFTGEAEVTFECGVDGGAYQACTSPFTIQGLSNGQHLFAVRAKDAAENTGPAALRSWMVRKTFTSLTITGTGTATAVVSGGGDSCDFDPAQTGFVNPITAPPAGIQFPHGLFRFRLVNCDAGSTATLRVQWPAPANGEYWKYSPVSQQWYAYPSASFDAATSTWTFTITDNGPQDADPAPGTIADPAGPALKPTDIPTLTQWAMLLLVATFLGIAWLQRGLLDPQRN